MDERQKRFLEEIFLPGLKELRERLSLTEEGKIPTGPLYIGGRLLAVDDFKILLRAFFTQFGDSRLKTRLLGGDLENPEFIDFLIGLFKTPTSDQKKQLAETVPPPEKLKELIEAQKRAEETREEIREEARKKRRERIAEIRKQYENLEEELQESFSKQVKKEVPEVTKPQASQISEEAVKTVRSAVLETPSEEVVTILPTKLAAALGPFALPQKTIRKVAVALARPETTTNTALEMAERIEDARRCSLVYRHQEELEPALALSLPVRVVRNRDIFKRMVKNLAQQGEFSEIEEFVDNVRKQVEAFNPELVDEINTEVLVATLSPGTRYCPKMPTVGLPEARRVKAEEINRLKVGLKNINTSPVGIAAGVIGVFSKKAELDFLVGFFVDDPQVLEALEAHYLGLKRKAEAERDFIREFFGETEEVSRQKNRVEALERTRTIIKGMRKEVKDPSLTSRVFGLGGRTLRKAGSLISKEPFYPLAIFADIKNLDLGRFLPPFLTSLPANLKKLSGCYFSQHFPGFFIKDSLGIPVFKFSLAGAKIGLGNLFSGVKDFLAQKILDSSFVQGAKALGGRVLAKLGLGGLAKIGLSLGARALGATLSAGGTLLLEGGLRLVGGAFNFLTTGLGGLLGIRREERGSGIPEGALVAGGLVAAVLVVGVLLPLFLFSQTASTFVAPQPFLLQQEEKTATPSATPPLTPGP